MKKIYIFIAAIIVACSSFGQALKPIASKINQKKIQKASFQAALLFEANSATAKRSNELATVAPNSTVMEFKKEAVRNIFSLKPENITLSIPHGPGKNIDLELTKATIFAPDFSVVTSSSNGQPVSYDVGVHYWGIIKGDNTSFAAISI